MSQMNSGSGNAEEDKPTQITTGGDAYIGGDVKIDGGMINVHGGRDAVKTSGMPSRVALLQVLDNYFDAAELNALAYDLNVEPDNLEGRTKERYPDPSSATWNAAADCQS